MRFGLSSIAVTGTFFGLCGAVGTTVDLGYAIYKGVVQPNEVVTQWLGMRFAAPPLGNLRFRAPQDMLVKPCPELQRACGLACREELGIAELGELERGIS